MYNEIPTGFPGSARKIKQKIYIYIYYSSVNLMVMFYVSGPVSLGAKRTFDIFDTADAFMAFITDGMYITDFA